MTAPAIIAVCSLLLLSYIFDISSSKIKIPSVILLLALGWIVRQGADIIGFPVPDLHPLLPVLGTIGLILIVLEGSLELKLKRKKLPFITKSFLIAFISLIAFCFILAGIFHLVEDLPFKICFINAIPLSVISSAIAIPSVHGLAARDKEFVTYESSLSNILGVIFFNYIAIDENIGINSLGDFVLKLNILLLITTVTTIGLSYLLNRIKHPVKFIPIIIILILVYEISIMFRLPALIFILLFGLFLANFDKLGINRFTKRLQPEALKQEIYRFKELTAEIAFLIRSLFFLLFGFLLDTTELFNTETTIWAIGIVIVIYILRMIILKLFRIPLRPLLFIAPRGLITILLFLSIPINESMALVDNSLITQVIIFTALIVMGSSVPKKKEKTPARNNNSVNPLFYNENGEQIYKQYPDGENNDKEGKE